MRFFAALRMILARESAADLINAAAHDAIQRWYLPEARKELKKARSDRDRGFWSDIVRLFEEYSDPRSTKGRHFGNQSAKKLIGVARAHNLAEEDIIDMTVQIIEDFYQKKWWKKLKVKTGPEGLIKFMTSMFGTNAKWRARDISTHRYRERTLSPSEDDSEVSPIEREPARGVPTGLEKMGERELMEIVTGAVGKKFRKPYERMLFQKWWSGLQERGSRLNLDRDVYAPAMKKYGISHTKAFETITNMRKEIANVLEKLGYEDLPKRFLGSSSLDLVDSVAYSEYVRRLARWVVAGTSCRLGVASRVLFL